MDFHKTQNIKTHSQLIGLIENYKNFIETGDGKPPQFLDEFAKLVPYLNGSTTYEEYTWIDQTEKEIEDEENRIKAESDLLAEYASNPEKWRNEVIKPWSMQKLREWIDTTFAKPLEFDLSEAEQAERVEKRLELLEYHNQEIYTAEPVKPTPPSYVK